MPKEERVKKKDGKTTFKPLNGGKFRCNQTGEVVKTGKTVSYRRARDMKLLGQGKKKAPQQKKKEIPKKTGRESRGVSVFGRRPIFGWGWYNA